MVAIGRSLISVWGWINWKSSAPNSNVLFPVVFENETSTPL
jgi:hypothetical protein